MNYDWTQERVDLAKKLFDDGLSASQIAGELPGPISRNAVIGKLNRLGYTRGAKGYGQKRPTRLTRAYDVWAKPERRAPFRPPEAPPQPQATELPPVVAANPVTLMELEPHHCRFPIGDPGTPEFRFCGGQKIADGSYCNAHHLLAYARAPRPTTISQEERAIRLRRERKAFGAVFG